MEVRMKLQGWKCVSGPDREHTYYLFMAEGGTIEKNVPLDVFREYGPFVPIPGSLGETDMPEIGLDLDEAATAIAEHGRHISYVRKPDACGF